MCVRSPGRKHDSCLLRPSLLLPWSEYKSCIQGSVLHDCTKCAPASCSSCDPMSGSPFSVPRSLKSTVDFLRCRLICCLQHQHPLQRKHPLQLKHLLFPFLRRRLVYCLQHQHPLQRKHPLQLTHLLVNTRYPLLYSPRPLGAPAVCLQIARCLHKQIRACHCNRACHCSQPMVDQNHRNERHLYKNPIHKSFP